MYWAKDRSLIPEEIFKLGKFEHVIEVGLAERRQDGIYVRGSERYFNWIFDARALGRIGGKKSAQIRKQRYGTAQPTKNIVEGVSKGDQNSPEGPFEISNSTNSEKKTDTCESLKQKNNEKVSRRPSKRPNPLYYSITSTNTSTSTNSFSENKREINNNKIPFYAAKAAPAKQAYIKTPKPPKEKKAPNKIALEISLEKRSVAVADRLMGIFREVGGNENAAKEKLPPWVWRLIESRWLKWDAFCVEATNAFRDGKATYFQAQLRASITAALLLEVDSRTNQASPSNGISPPNAQICPIND
jgi:hypothetical protein